MFDQTPSSSSSIAVTYANLSIDEQDVPMKNLQKLFNAHHQSAAEPLRSTFPFFIPHDNKHSSLKSTIVNGQALGCFVIGGECRLCFPQMRALCLGEISTQQIDETMKYLMIVNALASDEQLFVLKREGLVPSSEPKCELITKTNAERLISVLNSAGTAPIDAVQRAQLRSLNVVHDCFGGCSALLFPELAPNPCFECRTCLRMFGPEDFCRHTHHQPANNECFWGFDVSNWPFYIRVDDERIAAGEEAERQFVDFVQSYQT